MEEHSFCSDLIQFVKIFEDRRSENISTLRYLQLVFNYFVKNILKKDSFAFEIYTN